MINEDSPCFLRAQASAPTSPMHYNNNNNNNDDGDDDDDDDGDDNFIYVAPPHKFVALYNSKHVPKLKINFFFLYKIQ